MAGHFGKMVVWKDRKNEDDDARVGVDVGSIAFLWRCFLLKLFYVPSMRYHVRLLKYIVRIWNPKKHHFEVGARVLIEEVEDI